MLNTPQSIADLAQTIERCFDQSSSLGQAEKQTVLTVIELLDQGHVRVAEKKDGTWQVNDWVRKAILLYFKIQPMASLQAGDLRFYDKIPLKTNFEQAGIRVVPPAVIRYGSFLEKGCIVMPGYVNIGAHVGEGSMVDTFATVGACTQIGKGVHLSGGTGIGGVLEPPSARPVIIEDHAFIGSRCVVVEGVHIEEAAVLGAGVVLTASTSIVDVSGDQPVVYKGRVPARSVVIPGTMPKTFPAGVYQVPCALIVGQRKASTDQKTSLNDVLRTFSISV